MSFIVDYAEGLKEIRTSLADNTLINDPTNYSKLTGTVDFLLNPSLNSGEIETQMLASSNAGKYRPVEVKYLPYSDDDATTDDSGVSCDAGSQERYSISTYNADKFVYRKFTLDVNYLTQVLESGESIRGSELT